METAAPVPVCKCHGEPMAPNGTHPSGRKIGVAASRSERRSVATASPRRCARPRGEYLRHWKKQNREKVREMQRRG